LTNTLIIEESPGRLSKIRELMEELDQPRETKVFQLGHGRAEDILPKVLPSVSKDFGNIQADKRSNSLVVTDNPVRIAEITDIIKAFDAPNRAVLIEAKIVQVQLNDNSQWGVNWQYVFDKINDKNVAGTVTGVMQIIPTGAQGATDARDKGITATVGTMPPNDFTAAVSLLKSVGNTNLLSSPRVVAMNNEEAKIMVGTKEAYITKSIVNPGSPSQAPVVTEQVAFVDVGVKLAVVPTIGEDGYITMKLKPEVSSVESTVNTSNGSLIPIVRVSQAETSLVVKDGVTVVIGGLIEDKKSRVDNRVPILGRIPLLGIPFRSRSRFAQKTELVIFLTPRITTGDVQSPEVRAFLNPKNADELSKRKRIR